MPGSRGCAEGRRGPPKYIIESARDGAWRPARSRDGILADVDVEVEHRRLEGPQSGAMATCATCGAPVPEGARFCPTCAAPVSTGPDQSERKLATVVFADLVGSTELGGSQDPERTRAMRERSYEGMAAEIETAG